MYTGKKKAMSRFITVALKAQETEHSPHFRGIWEAAVKSFKAHLKRIVGPVKVTFEEMTTVLTQIEACPNSRPLAPMPFDDDGVEALTPGYFLIGHPLNSLLILHLPTSLSPSCVIGACVNFS